MHLQLSRRHLSASKLLLSLATSTSFCCLCAEQDNLNICFLLMSKTWQTHDQHHVEGLTEPMNILWGSVVHTFPHFCVVIRVPIRPGAGATNVREQAAVGAVVNSSSKLFPSLLSATNFIHFGSTQALAAPSRSSLLHVLAFPMMATQSTETTMWVQIQCFCLWIVPQMEANTAATS